MDGWGFDMAKGAGGGTYRERYWKFIAFVLRSQPANPGEITPELISGVIGCSEGYAYELEAERLGEGWERINRKFRDHKE